jgi:hypothetical protein
VPRTNQQGLVEDRLWELIEPLPDPAQRWDGQVGHVPIVAANGPRVIDQLDEAVAQQCGTA